VPRVFHHVQVLAFLLAAGLSSPAFTDPEPSVRLPGVPPVPTPTPTPAPDAVTRLAADQWYVIDSDVSVIVLTSPPGLVAVTEDAGPIKLKGKFVDGGGRVESRTFKGKSVFTVEAVSTGRVEIIIVPVGAKSATEVIRRVLDVDGNTGPIPPPKPPDPKPVDPLAKAISDAYGTVTEPDRRERAKALAAVMREASSWSANEGTNLALATRVGARVKEKCGDSLQPVRKAVTAYMQANFPAEVVNLTPELRTKFSAAYSTVARTLEELAP
jgi:hypothetical protein